MAYPSSVERVVLTGPKQGQQKVRPKFLPGHDTPLDQNEPEASVGVGGPILDFGRDGSATLNRAKGVWQWDWIKGNSERTRQLRAQHGVLLHPANRQLDAASSEATPSQIADAAVDYVRALPDVSEFASISDIIVEELGRSAKLPSFDAYEGDVLAVVENSRARMAKVMLAYPVGEVGNHLNISPFLPPTKSTRDRLKLTTFRAASKPVERFPTSILQICSSPYISGQKVDRDCTAMLIRLQTTTYMLNVDPHKVNTGQSDVAVATSRIGELSMHQTEGRRHMDMALDDTSWSRALIIDEGGGVWLWHEEKTVAQSRVTKAMQLRKVRDAVSQKRHGFFRIAFGSRSGTALVMSDTRLSVIDLESPMKAESTVLELTGQGRSFACLEKSTLARRADFTCVATNFEVMWVDELRVGSPVITWNHDWGRGAHRDLCLNNIQSALSEYTLLTCRTSNMAMVFEVDSSSSARSRQHPTVLSFRMGAEIDQLRSTVPVRVGDLRRVDEEAPRLAVLLLDGSLRTFDLLENSQETDIDIDRDSEVRGRRLSVLWDEALQSKESPSNGMEDPDRDWQDKAAAKHKIVDLSWVWQAINDPEADEGRQFTVDDFRRHLRELDAPFDSLATLGDLACDAVSDPNADRRTHALHPLPIAPDSVQDDLIALADLDPTKYSLTPIIRNEGTDWSDQVASNLRAPQTLDSLQNTFISNRGIDAPERARVQRDTQRLVFDLILSRTVVHSDDISPSNLYRQATAAETPEDLFQRTQQLTLNETPGSSKRLDPKFLAPRGGQQHSMDDATEPASGPDVETALQDPSACSLLSQWEIGADPTEYTWSSWRTATSRASTPIRRPVRPLPSPRSTQRFAQSQPTLGRTLPGQAPSLLPSTVYPAVRPPQESMRSSPPPVLQSSQVYPELGASTQVERGPFGGRLEGKKKKIGKKRVGGF